MANILSEWFVKFASETGILGEIRRYQEMGSYVLLLLGILGCFLGFWVYRAYVSVFLFFLIAYVSTICLSSRVDWGVVVTCFAVVGTALAILAYGWHRLGGCILCACIGIWIGTLVCPSVWAAILGGVLAVLWMLLFPVLALCSLTALWGGWLISDLLFQLVWKGKPSLHGLTAFICAGVGFGIQILLSRHQTLFAQTCPKRVAHWLEQKKGK